LVVGEGDIGIQQESEDAMVIVLEAVEEVGCLVLLGASLAGLPARMVGTGTGDDASVLAVGLFEDVLLQAVSSTGIVFPIEQEPAEFVGPEFAALLEEELQFAQKVLVAQGVEGVVFEVGFPEVMDEPGEAMGQDAE